MSQACFQDVYSYARANYQRRYAASLAFNRINVQYAFAAYSYGVQNGVGPTAASRYVQGRGGPVYTRLANFLRETKLWLVDEETWATIMCHITMVWSYFSPKKGRQRARITLAYLIPIHHYFRDFYGFLAEVFFEIMFEVGFNPVHIAEFDLEDFRVGTEPLETEEIARLYFIRERARQEIGVPHFGHYFTADIEFEIGRRLYTYRARLLEDWFSWASRFSVSSP